MSERKLKFADIVRVVGDCPTLFVPRTKWEIDDDGCLVVSPFINVDLETEVEVDYYFNHHMNPNFNEHAMIEAINNKDYNTFRKCQHDFSYGGRYYDGLPYLPYDATVCAGEWVVGDLDVSSWKELFELITHAECECG